MRAFRSAIGYVDQEAVAELLLNIGIPLLRIAVWIAQLIQVGAGAQQSLCITRASPRRSDDPARERIRDGIRAAARHCGPGGAIGRVAGGHARENGLQNGRGVAVDRVVIGAGIPGDIVRKPEYSISGVKYRFRLYLVRQTGARRELFPIGPDGAPVGIIR